MKSVNKHSFSTYCMLSHLKILHGPDRGEEEDKDTIRKQNGDNNVLNYSGIGEVLRSKGL